MILLCLMETTNELIVLAFLLGVFIQSILLVKGFGRKDLYKWLLVLLLTIFVGLLSFDSPFSVILGMQPADNIVGVIARMSVCYVFVFSVSFMSQILKKINATVLLAWSVLFFYLALENGLFTHNLILTIVLLVVCGLNVLNGFVRMIDNNYLMRVYFYVTFLVVVTGATLLTIPAFLKFYKEIFIENQFSQPWAIGDTFLAGMLVVTIGSYVTYLLMLLPSRDGGFETTRQMAAVLASQYKDKNNKLVKVIGITVGLSIVFGLNVWFDITSPSILAALVIVIMGFINQPAISQEPTKRISQKTVKNKH